MEKNMICGCMVEGENIPCVFDDPAFTFADCNFAKPLHAAGKGRDDCEYWKPMADEEHAASHITAEITQLTAERDRYRNALVAELEEDPESCYCNCCIALRERLELVLSQEAK